MLICTMASACTVFKNHSHHFLFNMRKINVGFNVHSYISAHEDSIWAVAWRKNEKDGTENIVSGGIDDFVKCWRW